MPSEVVRRRVIVRGRVQGVFFRASVRQAAVGAGVAGEAVNRPDGAVEVILEGAAASVDDVVDYCRTGPVNARVDSAEVTTEAPRGLRGFRTR